MAAIQFLECQTRHMIFDIQAIHRVLDAKSTRLNRSKPQDEARPRSTPNDPMIFKLYMWIEMVGENQVVLEHSKLVLKQLSIISSLNSSISLSFR